MILIPGLATSGAVYDATVAHLKGRYECHVVTLGGFGGEPRFAGPFLATARESLLAYIRARHLRAPILLGHSLGGVLALAVAAEAPSETGPLVILDALPFLGGAGQPAATPQSIAASIQPMCDRVRSESQADYAAFQRQSPYIHEMVTAPADLARVLNWSAQSDHVAVADAMFDVYTADLRADIARIHEPVLVLGTWYGMRTMTTRAAVDTTFHRQFAQLPQATIAVADSARHFLMLDAPEWTWGKIDAFLANAREDRPH